MHVLPGEGVRGLEAQWSKFSIITEFISESSKHSKTIFSYEEKYYDFAIH